MDVLATFFFNSVPCLMNVLNEDILDSFKLNTIRYYFLHKIFLVYDKIIIFQKLKCELEGILKSQ